jgi:hypothetical protein
LDFRSTPPAERELIRRLLREVFQASDDAQFVNRAHLEWKYYIERRDWPGSRSFVISEQDEIVAHACAWPFTVLFGGEKVRGFHPIDWAARASGRGAGTRLLREVQKLTSVSLSIGGTDAGRKAILNSGYVPVGEMKFYARPLRPWQQARTHQRRNWKLPARAARNWLWNARCPAAAPPGWTSQRVQAHEMPAEVFPVSNTRATACLRDADLFRYYEQCPIARHELHLVNRLGEPAGYFLLSQVPGQARVADAWVRSDNVDEWEALYRLAAAAAVERDGIAEITAASALPGGQSALEQAGFRMYEGLPIMLFDPQNRLAGAPPVHFQLIDNDFSFLHQGRPDYVT